MPPPSMPLESCPYTGHTHGPELPLSALRASRPPAFGSRVHGKAPKAAPPLAVAVAADSASVLFAGSCRSGAWPIVTVTATAAVNTARSQQPRALLLLPPGSEVVSSQGYPVGAVFSTQHSSEAALSLQLVAGTLVAAVEVSVAVEILKRLQAEK